MPAIAAFGGPWFGGRQKRRDQQQSGHFEISPSSRFVANDPGISTGFANGLVVSKFVRHFLTDEPTACL
jgi:hypothetical protein